MADYSIPSRSQLGSALRKKIFLFLILLLLLFFNLRIFLAYSSLTTNYIILIKNSYLDTSTVQRNVSTTINSTNVKYMRYIQNISGVMSLTTEDSITSRLPRVSTLLEFSNVIRGRLVREESAFIASPEISPYARSTFTNMKNRDKRTILRVFDPSVKMIDILSQTPPVYVSSLKNPCWYTHNGSDVSTLKCLPYFFIAGFPKCGTTDLFKRFAMHADVVTGCRKEPHFWTRRGFTRTFTWYTDCFSKLASKQAYSLSKADEEGHSSKLSLSSLVTDASASTLWDNSHWRNISKNDSSLDVPNVGIGHIIRHILPKAMFVVIMRNPTDRLYSDYNFFAKKGRRETSPELFHDLVVAAIASVNNCTSRYSIKWCLYNDKVNNVARILHRKDKPRFTLTVSIYAVYLEEWLKIFPRHQFHFIRSEDYKKDMANHLTGVFKFLNIPRPPDAVLDRMVSRRKANEQSRYPDMYNVTRAKLDEFFRPYNKRLADLIGDKRFMWE